MHAHRVVACAGPHLLFSLTAKQTLFIVRVFGLIKAVPNQRYVVHLLIVSRLRFCDSGIRCEHEKMHCVDSVDCRDVSSW